MTRRLPYPSSEANPPLTGSRGASCSGWPHGIIYFNREDDRCHLLLTADWAIRFRSRGRWYTLEFSRGFNFDGASIPRFAWSLVGSPFSGIYILAALPHDGLYQAELLPREQADEIFKNLIENFGGSAFTEQVFWAAVRVGGGETWERHTAKSIARARELVELSEDPQPRAYPGQPRTSQGQPRTSQERFR